MTSPARPSAPVAWAFCGVDGVDVLCPRALDSGVARVVGKVFDPVTGAYALAAEPTRYALARRDAATLRGFFAKALRLGQLLPADPPTAAAFGMPLSPPSPAPAPAPRPAPVGVPTDG